MRGRSLNKIILAFSAVALAGACTPDGEAPVLNAATGAQAAQMPAGVSGAGNYLAGRHAQKKRDFSNASRLLGKALENNNAYSLAKHSSLGFGVERPAIAIRRGNPSLMVKIPSLLPRIEANTTCQSHGALIIQQTLTGQLDGNQ